MSNAAENRIKILIYVSSCLSSITLSWVLLWSQMWDNIGWTFRCIAVLVFHTRFKSSCRRSGFCIGSCLDLRFVFRFCNDSDVRVVFNVGFAYVASLLVFVYEFQIVVSSDRFSWVITFAVSLSTYCRFNLILLVSFFILYSSSSFHISWVITSSCRLHSRGTAVIFPASFTWWGLHPYSSIKTRTWTITKPKTAQTIFRNPNWSKILCNEKLRRSKNENELHWLRDNTDETKTWKSWPMLWNETRRFDDVHYWYEINKHETKIQSKQQLENLKWRRDLNLHAAKISSHISVHC